MRAKRFCALFFAAFMLLSVLSLPVIAAENASAAPFPFDKYSDKHVKLWNSARIAHHDNVSSMEYIAEGEAFIEVYENEFEPGGNNVLRASQGVYIKIRNIPGLDYIIGKNPYFYYSIELYDEADRAKQIETWEKRAERAKLSRLRGQPSNIPTAISLPRSFMKAATPPSPSCAGTIIPCTISTNLPF